MVSNNPSRVTILVPTFNRPRELRRLLRFLSAVGVTSPVLVLDGSNAQNAAQNEITAAKYDFVSLRKYPSELHQGLRYTDGLRTVQTDYVVICPDDDFLFPEAVEQCVRFLEDRPDYSAACGRVLTLIYPTQRRAFSNGFAWLNRLAYDYDLSHQWAIQRILHLAAYTHTGCPPLFYAVRRTGQALDAFGRVHGAMLYSGQEHLTNCVTLAFGKARVLPLIYGLRDYASAPIVEPQRDDPDSYLSAGDLRYIQEQLVPLLQRQEGLSEQVATFLAKLCLEDFYTQDRWPHAEYRNTLSRAFERLERIVQQITAATLPGLFARWMAVDERVIKAFAGAQRAYQQSR